MLTRQYVNDLAISSAEDYLKTNSFKVTPIIKKLCKDEFLKNIFQLEFNNKLGRPFLSIDFIKKYS